MPTIRISDETKRRLDEVRHKNQSYHDVIIELLNQKEATMKKTRRK